MAHVLNVLQLVETEIQASEVYAVFKASDVGY